MLRNVKSSLCLGEITDTEGCSVPIRVYTDFIQAFTSRMIVLYIDDFLSNRTHILVQISIV